VGARGGGIAIALGVVWAVAGCWSTQYNGKLTVDRRPFVPRACKAGYHGQARGVDLTDGEGRQVRLSFAELPTEKFPYLPPAKSRPSLVAVKPPGAADWEVVGPCGPLLLEQAPHKTTFSGDMHLGCTSDRHQIDGRLQFENCYE
jgi:hypothetical protein